MSSGPALNLTQASCFSKDLTTTQKAESIPQSAAQATNTQPEDRQVKNRGSVSSLSSLRVGEKAYFGWSEVEFTLSKAAVGRSKKDPRVLKGIKGMAQPGEVVAIMGASGCGKTSLLNVLSGRCVSMNGHQVSGNFSINGQKVASENLGSKMAFVTQEDTLCPTATPREALEFSARLRLPPSVTQEERMNMVEEVITLLRLERCADSIIGDELIKGISGGEKRRTSIGIELITSPSIMFLDEPTSGLDSYAAFVVVNVLKDLASLGCTILCTIHQPSSEVFHLFNRVLLLSEGRTLYDGSIEHLSPHLATHGYPIPDQTNPADHVMFLMQTLEKGKLGEMCDIYSTTTKDVDTHAIPNAQASAVTNVHGCIVRNQAGWLTQFMVLGRRDVLSLLRNIGALKARGITVVALNLLYGLLFLNVGDTSRREYDIMSHFGALVIVAMGCMFGTAQPILLMFPSERPRFVREYATGTYGAGPYFWSKLLTELPLSFTTSLIAFIIVHWMMGLHGSFILHVLTAWILSLAAASTALFFGCIVPNANSAMQLAPAIFVPQILFAGLFIKLSQIPVWIRWAQYLCALKFAMDLFILNEFDTHCDQGLLKQCQTFMSSNDVEPNMWWAYLLILLGIFAFFRLIGLAALTRKARGFALN